MLTLYITTFLKFFFLLTPFFVLSTFLAMTRNFSAPERSLLALKTSGSVLVVALVIFGAGNFVFQVFGITLDAFRIGTGVLLFLTAIQLVSGGPQDQAADEDRDIAVVPLAIPVTVGPATTGALLVMGGEAHGFTELVVILAGISSAIVLVGAILLGSVHLERLVKRQGLVILSKVTGLILAALAAQLIMVGAQAFLRR
jgi:multiple antibiotic resistance protein